MLLLDLLRRGKFYITPKLLYKPGNLNGNAPIKGSGANRWGPNANGWNPWCRNFDLGSRGPSTVTFIAFVSVVTWTGDVDMHIVSVKLLPAKRKFLLNKKHYEKVNLATL